MPAQLIRRKRKTNIHDIDVSNINTDMHNCELATKQFELKVLATSPIASGLN